jgi:hypothetical protein
MHISHAAVSRALRAAAAAALLGGGALAAEPSPLEAAAAPAAVPAVDAASPAPALDAASPAPVLDAPLPPPPVGAKHVALGRRKHVLGLQIDAGAPDIAGVSVLYRPWKALRFSGGMLYDYVGYGVRGGVSVQPYFPIAPSLTLEAGHYFDADAYSKLSQRFTIDDKLKPFLQKFGYTFVNAQVGLELGHPDWFVFFVRAGLSRVWMTAQNANAAKDLLKSSQLETTFIGDPNGRFGIPNAKVGFMLFFY